MKSNHAVILLLFIVLGVLAGGVTGWYWGSSMVAVGWLGELFLNALKMMIVPLVVSSIINGVVSMKRSANLGKVGGYTLLYYMTTTAVAVLIGLAVVNVIQPGAGLEFKMESVPENVAG
jgi:Na+/H+-dicarboxylate symporter